MTQFYRIILWISMFMTLAPPATAGTVTLRNGDRITGEMEKLEGATLHWKTAYAGTIRIAWNMVSSIATDEAFRVELDTGQRLEGFIESVPEGLRVLAVSQPVELAPERVVAIEPSPETERSIWEKVDGTVDVGYSFTRGNSFLNQSSLGLSTSYRTDRYRFQGDLISIFSSQDGVASTSRQAGRGRLDLAINPQTFGFILSNMERDDRQRLNLRSNLGGGLGRIVARTRTTSLSLLGGFTFTNEQFRQVEGQPDGSGSSAEGLAEIDWSTTRFGRMVIGTKLTIYPNFVTLGRFRTNLDATIRVPLIYQLSWNLRFFDRFDSKPRQEGLLKHDYGMVAGVGFSF